MLVRSLAVLTLAAGLVLSAEAQAAQQKFAPSGVNQQIDFFASINPDCSSNGTPTVRLLQGPFQGVVTTDKGKDFLPFPRGNVRHSCNRKRLTGTKLFYRSAPHWIGTDHLRILILSGAGAGREADYEIEVR